MRLLFTIILEYRGGTYIAQVTAVNIDRALIEWAGQLRQLEIGNLTERDKRLLIAQLRDDFAEPVDGLVGVFCLTARVKNSLALVHMIIGRPVEPVMAKRRPRSQKRER